MLSRVTTKATRLRDFADNDIAQLRAVCETPLFHVKHLFAFIAWERP